MKISVSKNVLRTGKAFTAWLPQFFKKEKVTINIQEIDEDIKALHQQVYRTPAQRLKRYRSH